MLHQRSQRSHATLAILTIVVMGCARSTVSTPATPAPVEIAQLSKTLADAEATATKSLIALRDAGKVTQAETQTVENYILVAAETGKSMDAELVSTDTWDVQKSKIIQLWVGTGLGTAKSSLSPTAGLTLDTVMSVVNQILSAIGGPAI